MIDSLKTFIEKDQLPHNYVQSLQTILTDKKYTYNETGELIVTTGHYKDFFLSIKERGVYITGSLTAYIFGTNLKTAFKDDLYNGICKLSKELSINVFEGKVLRLDIATNIISHSRTLHLTLLLHTGS
ncbi:MAG: hypothetical protein P0Y49_11085 [Candidatus Pedobacter colombiensis]|uniref:Uncharacterized protein n=1 Tax=Candidatus Pedobacter colombiensis TaxID=3121371 RepID=A0AAJ6B979_9SPHI|nr:hypothetical protein [Pedobacter sp.]WEK21679.1 MAG: hypothetical protein P0Y49_11085 [Pedobacter sp.]